MKISQDEMFFDVKDFLNLSDYCCEDCSNVRKMIYTRETPRTCLGYIDILSNNTMPVITIEHYPNDSNRTLKKELLDQLNTSFTLKKLGTTEILCGMSGRFRERFEILELKNNL